MMKFTITREELIGPLGLVAGVVERRQTLPVLSNVLIVVDGDQLSLTGTDLEVELIGRITLREMGQSGEVTVPARKLVDICKNLPSQVNLNVQLIEEKLIIKAGRSRFTLSTLPATDFPSVEEGTQNLEFSVSQQLLHRLIERTSIAMAQQDVRYYLNGMLFEINSDKFITVATDGHRLAYCHAEASIDITGPQQVVVPRKGVIELNRLVAADMDEPVNIVLTANHIRATTGSCTFTSKLVDGKFPDYQNVIPKNNTKLVTIDREEFRQTLNRAAILSNEKYRGVTLILEENILKVLANNPEQEKAEESMDIVYDGGALEVGFNVGYLLDILSVISTKNVLLSLEDASSSILIEPENSSGDARYIVMPMRL